MVRLQFSIALSYEVLDASSDFIFNIHAAKTPCQRIVEESIEINQQVPVEMYTDPAFGTRYMRLQAANGPLHVQYSGTVDIEHHETEPSGLIEMPIASLPMTTMKYIYPSRYCQSDRLCKFATTEFGHIPKGYRRVEAIQDWVRSRTTFLSGSSNASTSAIDTLTEQAGVCRDFAHLMIALCRAVNIPARFVAGIDYGADPSLGPTDFHAYVEVVLSGRWYVFDPSGVSPPMGLLRLGTGRDAADASFATVFGSVISYAPVIQINAVADEQQGLRMPRHSDRALSSAAPA